MVTTKGHHGTSMVTTKGHRGSPKDPGTWLAATGHMCGIFRILALLAALVPTLAFAQTPSPEGHTVPASNAALPVGNAALPVDDETPVASNAAPPAANAAPPAANVAPPAANVAPPAANVAPLAGSPVSGYPVSGYPVSVRTNESRARFEITTKTEELVARCSGSCTMSLPKGRYFVSFCGADGVASPRRGFTVTGPEAIVVEPPDTSAADIGMAVGITGIAMFVGGLYLWFKGLDGALSENGGKEAAGDVCLGVGVLSALGGVVMMPVGWAVYGHNRKSDVTYTAGTEVSVAVLPQKDGGLLGVTGRF
jgi:hypothetical protein